MTSMVETQYQSNLTTYKYPPRNTFDTTELQNISEERLRLYRILLQADELELEESTEEWKRFVENGLRNIITFNILLNGGNLNELQKARRNNHISHWILSLVYSSDVKLRECFIKCELKWIKLLFESANENERMNFFRLHRSLYEVVKAEEKIELKYSLTICSDIKPGIFDRTTFYKTKFGNIIRQVIDRKVFLRNGYAYFMDADRINFITCQLEKQFKEQLEWNENMLNNIKDDERIKNLLNNLPLVQPNLVACELLNITLDDLDEIYNNHYPLCMKHMHNLLKENHHLKHGCRMQYGIFLKNLGLPLEDALELFKTEFTEIMTEDTFRKKYSYYFKHYYGTVGSCINYEPYSCEYIQNMHLGPMENHGCPFIHWSLESLKNLLVDEKVPPKDICDIEDLVTQKKYKTACSAYYYCRNRSNTDFCFSGPNEYCYRSYTFEKSLDDMIGTICYSL